MCQPTRAIVASARAVAVSAEVVFTKVVSVEAVSAGVVAASVRATVGWLSFFFLENYMFSLYIILVSNRLVGWYLMRF